MIELLHILHAIGLAGLFAAFCLGTGVVAARWLRLSDGMIVPVGFGCTSMLGMIAFCVWWFSPKFGASLSLACGLGAVAIVTSQLTVPETRRRMSAAAPALIATLLLAASWLCLVHAGGVPAAKRFTWNLPIDNQLPRIFADRIAASRFSGPITGTWLASDRPPLQAGVLLLFRPFLAHGQIARETVETLCQLMWLPALAALGAALRFKRREIVVGLLVCATSGFFLVNSIYTWPKLMAAALFVTAIAAVIELNRSPGPKSLRSAGTAGALLALATLAHGGVWFSLLALPALPAAWPALRRFGVRGVAVLCVTFAVVSAPWVAYQHFVDPPGNRLVKMHLAGAAEIDGRSSFEALRDSYAAASLADLVKVRWENAGMVVLPPASTPGERWDAYLRRLQFFYLVPCVGLPLLGIAWIIVHRMRKSEDTKPSGGLVLYCAATVAIWIALIFLPGGTIVHAGSYVPIALLIFLGGVAFARWRTVSLLIAVTLHVSVFLAAWILSTPPRLESPLSGSLMLIAAILSVAAWAAPLMLPKSPRAAVAASLPADG